MRLRERAAGGLEAARAHPRHIVLAGVVAGLLLGPLDPALAMAAAASGAAAAGRPVLALMTAGGVLAGASLADARLAAADRSALGPLLGRQVAVVASLTEPARRRPTGSVAAWVRLERGPGRGERVLVRAPRRVRWPRAEVGDVVRARGRLVPLRDQDGWARSRGAHAVLLAGEVAATGRARTGLSGVLDRVRRRAEDGMSGGLPPPQAALMRGMVLGQDHALTEETREAFRRSGLAHLLAASGANVMLLATLALPLLGALGLGLRPRLAVVLALIALYVPLAGAGPSIQRAGVMGAAGIVAGLAGRPRSRWYALLLAAALTLALDPRASSDPGWQLSFAAVIGILAMAPGLRAWLGRRSVPGGLADACALTFAATLATAPLLAHHFEQVSPVSLPANLLAAPVVAPIMWAGTLAAVTAPVLPAAGLLLAALSQYGLGYLQWLAGTSAALPGASLEVGLGSAWLVAGAYAALGAGVLLRRLRAPLALVCAAAVAAAGAGATRLPDPPRHLTVSFLDVGQGDATLIQSPDGAAVLFDGGPPEGRVAAQLQRAGVRRLSLVVMTHQSRDHHGGLQEVVERFGVDTVLENGDGTRDGSFWRVVATARERGARIVEGGAEQAMTVGALTVRVLGPPPRPPGPAPEDPNPRALVTVVSHGDFDLFLSGDAESEALHGYQLPDVEAMKVPHHGSADPGLPQLLERLRPQVAAIEVGRNSYGHPAPETLAALNASVPLVFRTDTHGTIRLTLHDGRMSVATDR